MVDPVVCVRVPSGALARGPPKGTSVDSLDTGVDLNRDSRRAVYI